MIESKRITFRSHRRAGFTLVEMLVVVMVIVILASSVLFSMWGAMEDARVSRTQTQVTKLNNMLMTHWDAYRTRPIRLIDASTLSALPVAARRDSRLMATARLNAIRDLMRLEMPDRKTDVLDPPVANTYSYGASQAVSVTIARPAVSRFYLRQAQKHPGWTEQYQDAECLYLIVSGIHDLTSTGLEFLRPTEVGDLDEDGMPEILDAWQRPIIFQRWPAGFVEHPGNDAAFGTSDDIPAYGNLQVQDPVATPDPFDPLKVDRRPDYVSPVSGITYKFNFATYPLICSGGPDEVWDIVRFDYDTSAPETIIPFHYNRLPNRFNNGWPQNDPYAVMPNSGRRLGEPFLESTGYIDNITNHALAGD